MSYSGKDYETHYCRGNRAQVTHYDDFRRMRGERTKLFFGLELEVEVKQPEQKACTRVREALGEHIIIKSEHMANGFEIVTLPATLNYHRRKLWGNFFDAAPDYLTGDGSSPCGLHIHFSRNAVLPMDLAKILVFFSATENNDFLTKMAGRLVGRSGAYNVTMPKNIVEGNPDSVLKDWSARGHRGAIWISSRTAGCKTVEVRIFKSIPTKNHVLSCLELVAAVIEWSKVAKATAVGLNYSEFVKWIDLDKNKKNYSFLVKTLQAHKYVDIITAEDVKAESIIARLRKRVMSNAA